MLKILKNYKKKYLKLRMEYNTLENKYTTIQEVLTNDILKILENNDSKTLSKYKNENKQLRKKIKILKEMISEDELRRRISKSKSVTSRKRR